MKKTIALFVMIVAAWSASAITLISPNGGEVFQADDTYPLIFETDTDMLVNIEISLDGGEIFFPFEDGVPCVEGITNHTFYAFATFATTECLFRVYNANNPVEYDDSDNVFSIVSDFVPPITIISPNGGEELSAEVEHTLTFEVAYDMVVNIALSLDNGLTWFVFDPEWSAEAGTNFFSWQVNPSTNSTECRFRVRRANNPMISDLTNSTFSISASATPTIEVTEPNGGESFAAGSFYQMSFDVSEDMNVQISLSVNNGQNYSPYESSWPATAGTNTYQWFAVPGTNSDQCRFRVSKADDPSVSDASDATFTIATENTPPSITITSPNGGEEFSSGEEVVITWDATGMTNVDIQLSYNGFLFEWIAQNVNASPGTFTWTVPSLPGDEENCVIKIRDNANPNTFDITDEVFTILADTPSSVIDHESGNSFLVYPNPARDELKFESFSVQGDVSIVSIDGRVIQQMTYTGEQVLDVSHLPEGTYMLIITAAEKRYTASFCVVR